MTAMRPPTVAGLAGGVGTTLIATLIGATDLGVFSPGETVDVLVCRSVAHQLAAVTAAAASMTPAPVVVIVADCADKPPRPVTDRARMLEPNVAAVLWCPWVPSLRAVAAPAAAARDGARTEPTPGWARGIRRCRDDLIAAVVDLLAATTPGPTEPSDLPARSVPDGARGPATPPADDPADTDPASGPLAQTDGQAAGTLRAIRPPHPPPPPPALPSVDGDDGWSAITPDAPPAATRPGRAPVPSGDADRLRRTS